jgi:hypothetical protein
LLELDVSKGAGPDGIPPLILKNCASIFARPLALLFNRSSSTCVFTDKWTLSYVTPIFKKGWRNNVEVAMAILSAIPKRSELLVYRTMYDDLKNFFICESTWFYEKPIDGEFRQVDSVYTNVSKASDRVRHQLLLEGMSVGIGPLCFI